MTISVASGKGGTGKTTVAVGLARVAGPVTLADCDVEAPNCHLFLRRSEPTAEAIHVTVPQVDPAACTLCGACARACRFHALAVAGRRLISFPKLCHGCGSCVFVCPQGALSETRRRVGVLEREQCGSIHLITGRLDLGEAMATPAIRHLKCGLPRDALVLLDSAPGTACSMVAAVKGTDFCLLVTEPTPFGLHDLRMAVGTLRCLEVPSGVVVNRSDGNDSEVEAFCLSEGIPVLGHIPLERRAAEAYSRGIHPLDACPEWRPLFEQLLEDVLKLGARAGRYAA